MHNVLERQLRKIYGALDRVPLELRPLLEVVSRAYAGADDDRKMTLRSLEISSKELETTNTELRNQLAIFDALMENMQEAILIETVDRRVFVTNQRFRDMFDIPLSAERLVGASCIEAVKGSMAHMEDPERFIARIEETIAARKPVTGEGMRTRPGRLYERDYTPIIAAGGRHFGHMWRYRDVTEASLDRARILELNILKNKFIQIVSHQLRTPLSGIRWSLETLLADRVGELNESQREFVRIAHDADTEIIQRISDLITAMDIEEGRTVIQKEAFSIESLWQSVMADWMRRCKVKGLECVYTPTEELPAVQGDAEKVRDVLETLVDNAVSYSKADGRIKARFACDRGLVRFEIEDAGIGIPAVEQPRIFTRFYRASNAPTMKPDSSGLGLFISKHYVEQHGGQMSFRSTEGKGSTFWFELPAIRTT